VASVTIGLGVLLVVLGVGGYFASGRVSKTALIPAFFGGPILLLGLAALRADWHDYALYGALGLAGLGFFGSGRGLPGLWKLLSGGEVKRPAAVIAQSIMAVLCLAFVVVGVWSLAARPGP
jgi:hypothetical protein